MYKWIKIFFLILLNMLMTKKSLVRKKLLQCTPVTRVCFPMIPAFYLSITTTAILVKGESQVKLCYSERVNVRHVT